MSSKPSIDIHIYTCVYICMCVYVCVCFNVLPHQITPLIGKHHCIRSCEEAQDPPNRPIYLYTPDGFLSIFFFHFFLFLLLHMASHHAVLEYKKCHLCYWIDRRSRPRTKYHAIIVHSALALAPAAFLPTSFAWCQYIRRQRYFLPG